MPLTDRKPTGVLKALLRAPIWLYKARLGWLSGRRIAYIAHRGRRSGLRREVVVEVVRDERGSGEFTVIAAWGGTPDWYRNLLAAPAIEVRIGAQHWPQPGQRFPEPDEVLATLHAYQQAHPRAWKRLAPLLGFPTDPADPAWPDVAARVHAVAFRRHRP